MAPQLPGWPLVAGPLEAVLAEQQGDVDILSHPRARSTGTARADGELQEVIGAAVRPSPTSGDGISPGFLTGILANPNRLVNRSIGRPVPLGRTPDVASVHTPVTSGRSWPLARHSDVGRSQATGAAASCLRMLSSRNTCRTPNSSARGSMGITLS